MHPGGTILGICSLAKEWVTGRPSHSQTLSPLGSVTQSQSGIREYNGRTLKACLLDGFDVARVTGKVPNQAKYIRCTSYAQALGKLHLWHQRVIGQGSSNMSLDKIKGPGPAVFEFTLRWLTAVYIRELCFLQVQV